LQLAQGANRRAALGRADQRFFPTGSAFLDARHQIIVGGQLIDTAASGRTVAEVGGDVRQLRLGELAQGQRTQRFVIRVVQRGLAHDRPLWVRRTAKRQRCSSRESLNERKTLHRARSASSPGWFNGASVITSP
jgi:hypothetical protein